MERLIKKTVLGVEVGGNIRSHFSRRKGYGQFVLSSDHSCSELKTRKG